MSANEIRQRYLAFFKRHSHTIIPSALLVPENDPTTLFTGSGMQPLLPYLLGEAHPEGNRLVNSQKCFRSGDIEEVGDNRHTTFFEMLGNWSLGDYFKTEQLSWVFSFLTDDIGLDPKNLYVTAFIGDEKNNIPRDTESVALWKGLFAHKGIEAKEVLIGSEVDGYAVGMQGGRIFYYDAKKNWWSRSGVPEAMPAGEPGGPDSEIFYDFGTPHDPRWGTECHPNCDCGRFLEIGNSVFMQYVKNEDGTFGLLPKQNVDFGGGLERIAAAAQKDADVFKTSGLFPIIRELEAFSGGSYSDPALMTSFRVIADHARAAVFLIADGVVPSNTDQGYFVRRLLRRSVRYADMIKLPEMTLAKLVPIVAEEYREAYPKINATLTHIAEVIADEERKFRQTLEKGLHMLEKIASAGKISGQDAYILFTTHGFPIELTEEIAKERGARIDRAEFEEALLRHRELSRAGSEQKFRGGLADLSDKVVQYHTVTHLMLAGLRKELGDGVHQAGSNITTERLRFDFTHPAKVPRDVLNRVEEFVNNAIKAGATVSTAVLDKEVARNDPAIEGSFWEKYPDKVTVYSITDSNGTVYSRELCGGPHVESTGKIKGVFKIQKEESSSAGVRRIKAVLL